jgi:hypothetical protein
VTSAGTTTQENPRALHRSLDVLPVVIALTLLVIEDHRQEIPKKEIEERSGTITSYR